ncbi:TPA: DUF1992 domain-containing protein [Yersinia enterocolitica]|uniref:DUF1992 domain-containing protein n=3 Tax=Yersinia enterocolitica TaxID=630 RepID=A0A7T9XQP2_YEREN|nr:DUF1992 domain-containing protein [Yersinia enterocolitica]CBX71998.1 uncharacterized protein yhdN [Yersinia enterocolitica W22703]ADZ44108.1 hypothetical protein YE105_C3614 [Yersinia enterocolitica subsp. palearctica 105.5R(r)]AJJ29377.1 hypothetical protein CH48_1338 [Yersinia enterocolitica]ALG77169.1 hypothetical protein XM56_01435 [Yersinia enterocolitica]EHB21612.1 hypothetical protein IOK_07334 [Yersinia enterocolitica subsp. palearctica PhRBD_Ye1]
MGLIDEWAERHITNAQEKGEFEDLSGHGQPLILDDDTFVPAELRAGYRLLKNAGYLPPELQDRQEALTITDLLSHLDKQHDDYANLHNRLALLELRLKQAGLSTDFLRQEYQHKVTYKLSKGE